MKTIIATFLVIFSIILLPGIVNKSLANSSNQERIKNFNVKEYLKVDGQKQSYLEEDKNPIATIIIQAINFIALSIATISFVIIIIGGYHYVTSLGNATQMNKGKEIITYAIIGLIISLSAYWIISLTQSLLYEIK